MKNNQWIAPLWIFGDALFATAWVVAAKTFFVHTGTYQSISIVVLWISLAVVLQGVFVAGIERKRYQKPYNYIPKNKAQWLLVAANGIFVALTEYFLLMSFVYNANLGYSAILVVGMKAIVVNICAKKIFNQHLNATQWVGVWLGIFASVLVAIRIVTDDKTIVESDTVLFIIEIPIWLGFVILMNITNLTKEICSRKQFESTPVGSGIMWTGIFMIPMSLMLYALSYDANTAELPKNFKLAVVICAFFHGLCVFCRTKAKWLQVNPLTHESLRFAYGMPMKMLSEALYFLRAEKGFSPIFVLCATCLSMLSAYFVIPPKDNSER